MASENTKAANSPTLKPAAATHVSIAWEWMCAHYYCYEDVYCNTKTSSQVSVHMSRTKQNHIRQAIRCNGNLADKHDLHGGFRGLVSPPLPVT